MCKLPVTLGCGCAENKKELVWRSQAFVWSLHYIQDADNGFVVSEHWRCSAPSLGVICYASVQWSLFSVKSNYPYKTEHRLCVEVLQKSSRRPQRREGDFSSRDTTALWISKNFQGWGRHTRMQFWSRMTQKKKRKKIPCTCQKRTDLNGNSPSKHFLLSDCWTPVVQKVLSESVKNTSTTKTRCSEMKHGTRNAFCQRGYVCGTHFSTNRDNRTSSFLAAVLQRFVLQKQLAVQHGHAAERKTWLNCRSRPKHFLRITLFYSNGFCPMNAWLWCYSAARNLILFLEANSFIFWRFV